MSESIRTFVAIELPSEIHRGLAQVQDRLKRGRHPVRWVAPSKIHLTLKFLGDISRADVEAVGEAAAGVAADASPFVLEAVGVGVFPNPRRARVVWVGVEGDLAPLRDLHQRLEQALAERGFPPERRRFSPHLTIGRTRRRTRSSEARALGTAVSELAIPSLGRWTVEEFVVMRSDLRPQGPIYTPQRVVRLGASAS